MPRRISAREWDAIVVALNASLASPVLDGFDEGSAEERAMRRRMLSVLVKAQERREATAHERRLRAETR